MPSRLLRRLPGTRRPSPPGCAVIEPPARLDWVDPFTMDQQDGRDQIVRAIVGGGWDAFEHPMPDLFAAVTRKAAGVVLDIGANTGFYSLLATASSARLKVHAFEPFPPVFALLERNVAGNGRGESVTAVPVAVSAEPGRATLHVPSDEHGLVETSCSLDEASRHEFASAVDVPVTTVDEYVRLLDEPVQSMKIDVECMDHEVLAGATGTVSRQRPVIFFEQLPHGQAAPIEAMRRQWDYVSAALAPDGIRIEREVSVHVDAWNHVLWPAERLPDLLAAADSVGLAVARWVPPAG